jgi:hypothetical protein
MRNQLPRSAEPPGERVTSRRSAHRGENCFVTSPARSRRTRRQPHQRSRSIPTSPACRLGWPSLFVQVVDPVGQGFVASAARPGGNVTGFQQFLRIRWAASGWCCLRRSRPTSRGWHLLPILERPHMRFFLRSVEAAAPRLRIELISALVHITAETERTFSKHRTLAPCRIRNAANPHPRAPAK